MRIFIISSLMLVTLTGCIPLLVGAGAGAGGYYFGKKKAPSSASSRSGGYSASANTYSNSGTFNGGGAQYSPPGNAYGGPPPGVRGGQGAAAHDAFPPPASYGGSYAPPEGGRAYPGGDPYLVPTGSYTPPATVEPVSQGMAGAGQGGLQPLPAIPYAETAPPPPAGMKYTPPYSGDLVHSPQYALPPQAQPYTQNVPPPPAVAPAPWQQQRGYYAGQYDAAPPFAPANENAAGDAQIAYTLRGYFLNDRLMQGHNIEVVVTNAIVGLDGSAMSLDQYERAELLARSTPGVRLVENRLRVVGR